MIFRWLPFCLVLIVLLGCKSPVVQSVDPGEERKPAKQEPSKVDKGSVGVMEITSDDFKQDDENQTATFTGNVDMRHPDFRIECDLLVVFMKEGPAEPGVPFKAAIATGARVVVERETNKGVPEKGVARRAVFNPKTGNIFLSGGRPTLTSGGTEIKTDSPDVTIILKKDGSHIVKNRSVESIPSVPKCRIIAFDASAPVRTE